MFLLFFSLIYISVVYPMDMDHQKFDEEYAALFGNDFTEDVPLASPLGVAREIQEPIQQPSYAESSESQYFDRDAIEETYLNHPKDAEAHGPYYVKDIKDKSVVINDMEKAIYKFSCPAPTCDYWIGFHNTKPFVTHFRKCIHRDRSKPVKFYEAQVIDQSKKIFWVVPLSWKAQQCNDFLEEREVNEEVNIPSQVKKEDIDSGYGLYHGPYAVEDIDNKNIAMRDTEKIIYKFICPVSACNFWTAYHNTGPITCHVNRCEKMQATLELHDKIVPYAQIGWVVPKSWDSTQCRGFITKQDNGEKS